MRKTPTPEKIKSQTLATPHRSEQFLSNIIKTKGDIPNLKKNEKNQSKSERQDPVRSKYGNSFKNPPG